MEETTNLNSLSADQSKPEGSQGIGSRVGRFVWATPGWWRSDRCHRYINRRTGQSIGSVRKYAHGYWAEFEGTASRWFVSLDCGKAYVERGIAAHPAFQSLESQQEPNPGAQGGQ